MICPLAAGVLHGPFAQRDLYGQLARSMCDGEGDGCAWRLCQHGSGEIQAVGDSSAIHGGDDVARLQSARLRGAGALRILGEALNLHALRGKITTLNA